MSEPYRPKRVYLDTCSFDCSITTLPNPAAEKVLNFKNFNLSYPSEKVRARKKMQAKLWQESNDLFWCTLYLHYIYIYMESVYYIYTRNMNYIYTWNMYIYILSIYTYGIWIWIWSEISKEIISFWAKELPVPTDLPSPTPVGGRRRAKLKRGRFKKVATG